MHVSKPYKRCDRVGPLIHRQLTTMLARGIVDSPFEGAYVTISSVDVSPDFAQAKVYFSLLDQSLGSEVSGYLNGKAGEFQYALAKA